MIIRLPWTFYLDHRDRALATPPAFRETKANVWIDTNDPAYDELLADARWYAGADGGGPGTDDTAMTTAARRLLDAVRPEQLRGRHCVLCSRRFGVTYHAAEFNGRMTSVPSHIACFRRWQARPHSTRKD